MKKILITGGHLTPALATIEVLKKKNWQIVYVGREHALEGDRAPSQELRIITAQKIPFRSITAGRLQRRLTPYTFFSYLKIPLGLLQAIQIVLSEKPDVVLSFGGYVALPIVVGAYILRIPIVTHEQTFAPGLANRLISKMATKICISWKETEHYFSSQKVVLTGNPVRPEIFELKNSIPINLDKPVVYITGGNLGSHRINVVVESLLDELLTSYSVIHQCGNAAEFNDLSRLTRKRENLPQHLKKRYYVTDYIDADQIGWVFKKARVVVSRAGANSITELLLLAKPALLIPLPWSGKGEQRINAQFLAHHGGAYIIEQENLTGDTLLASINKLAKEHDLMQKNLVELRATILTNAASHLVEVVESIA